MVGDMQLHPRTACCSTLLPCCTAAAQRAVSTHMDAADIWHAYRAMQEGLPMRCRVHINASYAGPFAMLPELRHHFEGIDQCDSFVTDPCKVQHYLQQSVLLQKC